MELAQEKDIFEHKILEKVQGYSVGLEDFENATAYRVNLWEKKVYQSKNRESFDQLIPFLMEQKKIYEIRNICSFMEEYELLGNLEEELGNYEEAIDVYVELSMFNQAARILENIKGHRAVKQFWEVIEEWKSLGPGGPYQQGWR